MFGSIIDIEKNNDLIAEGATAKIFNYSQDSVIKIYNKNFDKKLIQKEIQVNRIVNEIVRNSPKILGVIEEEKTGIVLEKIDGLDGGDLLIKEQKMISPKKLASLHYDIHQNSVSLDNKQKDILKYYQDELINYPEINKSNIESLISTISHDNKLCHGDFHFKNIMIDKHKKYYVIDWLSVFEGNPILDVMKSYLIFNTPFIQTLFDKSISDMMKRSGIIYLNEYSKLSNIDAKEILMYLPLVAAQRYIDNHVFDFEFKSIEDDWLLSIINGE